MRCIGLASSLVLILATAAASAAPVKFSFAPNPRRSVLQRLTTRTVTRVVGDTARREVLQESVTRIRFERAGKGWRMLATPITARTLRDGVESPDAMSRAMLGRTIVYRLGTEAQVESIDGFDAAIRALLDSLPADVRAATAAALDPETLRQRETRDFESRITEWVGAEVEDGTEVPYRDVAPLPSGSLVMHARVHVGPVETRDGRSRVRLRTAFDTDSTALASLLGRVIEGTASASQLDSLPVAGPRVMGFGDRLVDPATLDILAERSDRVLHLRVNVPGRGEVMAIRTEERRWAFEEVDARGH